jgi:multiple sugar transport system substrate-binding protein
MPLLTRRSLTGKMPPNAIRPTRVINGRGGALTMATTLRVLLVGGPMYDPLYSRLPEFEAREGVRVEVVATLPHPELNERIAGGFGAGTARYDLISTHIKYAPSQMQWLTPLDDDLSPDELQDFAPRTLELARIGGRLYGVPRNLDIKLLHYRTDLIASPPSSWEGLLAEASRLRSGDVYGFTFPGRESGLFGHFFELHAMAGGRMFRDPESPVPTLNDEAGHWALTLLSDLYQHAAPRETPDWHYDEVAACFRTGHAAISTDWPGGYYTYEDPAQSQIVGRYDVALYPEGRAGRFIYSGSHTFAIPNTVKDRPAALALLRFLTSRESQAHEARLGTLPARIDSLRDARADTPDGSLAQRRWDLLQRASKFALLTPKHPNYPAVEDTIWEGVREALTGRISIGDALKRTEDRARRAAEGTYA